jgi:large subunit ribosomal protein L25
MRQTLELAAEPRAKTGKGPAYRLRLKGTIPGVVYGGDADPENVQVDAHNFGKLYSGGALLQSIVMLELGGKKTKVLPRAIQLDPVSDRPVHVDFLRLTPGSRISLDIPVRFHGHESSPGLKRGGVLNIVRHEVALFVPVDDIPEYIEASIESLDIGDSIHISAFTLPAGVTPAIRGRDFTVATLAPPTTYTEETPTVAATAEGAAAGATTEGAEGEAGAAAPATGAAAAAPAAGAKGAAPAKGAPAAKK